MRANGWTDDRLREVVVRAAVSEKHGLLDPRHSRSVDTGGSSYGVDQRPTGTSTKTACCIQKTYAAREHRLSLEIPPEPGGIVVAHGPITREIPFTHNIIGGTIILRYWKYIAMATTETESRCIAKCRSCGDVFTAELRTDGTLRPIGVADCSCGRDDFRRMGF